MTTGQVDRSQDTGSEAIPDEEFSQLEQAIDGWLRPYFNESGTDTVLEVAAGEYFELYMFAEYTEGFAMNAAEYKLVLPEEVSVMSKTESDSTILSLGKHDEDFMIAFHCTPGPKNWLVRYNCKAHEDFVGGTVSVVRGVNMNFLGFTMCDASFTLVKARGGTASLRKK